MAQTRDTVVLPKPSLEGANSLEKVLQRRRSVRAYRGAAVTVVELGQLLWAAQGVNSVDGLRTTPSAGALYPLELYVATGKVEDLVPAIYHYRPPAHELDKISDGDVRKTLGRASLDQMWLAEAAAVVAITAAYRRTTRKYGERGIRYADIEAGHAAQNLFLQAEALGLGTVVVGAFDDAAVARALKLPADCKPLVLMPIDKRRVSV